MVKWRIERGVVQQTDSLVRGFYEVSDWFDMLYLNNLTRSYDLFFLRPGTNTKVCVCVCVLGGGCQASIGV